MDVLESLRQDLLDQGACVRTPYGERRITYADHIASGRHLRSVEDALTRAVLPLYANTHTEDSATGALTTRLTHEAAEYIKECLGADEHYKLLFPGTGATGALKRLQEILGVSVPPQHRQRLLESLPASERPVVFVGPYEHHSNEVSWRESLAQVVTVPLDRDGLIDEAALRSALTDPAFDGRQKIGSFSAASNVTGLISDVRGLASLLHDHGAVAVFDYAASAPYVKVDVRPSREGENDWLDAVVLSPHKLLGGPGSPGLLLLHESLYHLDCPTTAGGGTVTYVSRSSHRYVSDVELREDAGTPAIIQKLRAAMAFRVKEKVGVENIERREQELVRRALDRLVRIPGVRVLGNLTAPRLAVASFLVESGGKQLHPKLVVRLLSDLFGIQGRAGCSCAGPYGHALLDIDEETSGCFLRAIEVGYEGVKPGWARVSFHYLLTEEEFEFVLDAIAFVAEHGHRFVHHYGFDWRSGSWRHRAEAKDQHAAFDPDGWTPVARSARSPKEDFAAYLDAAYALARDLSTREPEFADEPAPEGLDPRTLWFAV
ncbi:MAG TPA: aminotransferase class V-fold PLP-dependent enzyme [Trueperaceae bacterium]|nr:aminotransferase class V-fold PLP-dependent enzyme [Trueperaceae bacterium]